jgi:dolichol-phosphate mannosyltransferase
MISIIIPCFNESGNLDRLVTEVTCVMQKVGEPYEILAIDDGSTDNTHSLLRMLKDKNVLQYVSFSRNFGHQAALKAGLDLARGDAVISMDGDLQHPPSLIPAMVAKWREGFQIVNTVRTKTQNQGIVKDFTSRLFYYIFKWISGLPLETGSADFRLMDQRVVQIIRQLNEPPLFLRGLIAWVGFNTTTIPYVADERYAGRTKYSMKKMMKFARDGLMSFSIRPLRIAGVAGLVISIVSGLYALYSLWIVIFTNRAVPGWASILVSVLFVGGVQMIFLGLLGEYVGKIFIENKHRPSYLIKEQSQP